MFKAPRYLIYSNTPSHTNGLWAKSENATQAILIRDVETISRSQLNQKLKLMVEAPGYVLYFNEFRNFRNKWKS